MVVRPGIALAVWVVACGGPSGESPGEPDGGVLGTDGGEPMVDGAAAIDCRLEVGSGEMFGAAQVVSDEALSSLAPVIAASGGRALIAWHEFGDAGSRIAYAVVERGCVGEIRRVDEPLAQPIRPSAAATADGFVLAYHASDGGLERVRAVWLGADGEPEGPPETISAEGASGSYVRVATSGEETAFAWLDATGHAFARRGPLETVAATHVPNAVDDLVVDSSPRVALDPAGTVFLAYRNGSSTEQEIFLLVRPKGGAFAPKVNVSQSPELLSDEVSMAVEPDGALDIAWIDQDPEDVNSFEVEYRRRAPAGSLGPRTRYGTQGLWSWSPSVLPGLTAAWRTGQGGIGPLYFAAGAEPPVPILDGETGSMPALARTSDGAEHLVFQDGALPRRIRYAWRAPEAERAQSPIGRADK
jgi:hypothetical protein